MRHFTNVHDIGDLKTAVREALEVKANRFAYKHLGQDKTLMMIFFNSSLRTRLSTQKAAMNLGMNVMVLDVNQGAWKLETERGVVMDGDKPEHLLEAIPVMGCYCDVIGVRSFARFENKRDDYEEKILNQFILVLSVLGLLFGLLALLLVEVHILAGSVVGLDAHHAQVQLGLQPAAIELEQVVFELEEAQQIVVAHRRVGKGVAHVEAGLCLVAYRAGVSVAVFGLLDAQEGGESRGYAFETERILKVVPGQLALVPELIVGKFFGPGVCREQERYQKENQKPFHRSRIY